MDSPLKSSSSGVSDSWLFVKNINEDEMNAGKNPESINHIKTTDEMEDSDGISVISESEMMKEQTSSDTEVEKGQIAEEIDQEANFEAQDEAKNNQEDEEIEDPNLLTPPRTPFDMTEEKVQELQINALEKYQEKAGTSESVKCHKNSHGVWLLIGMSLIIAVLYTNVTSLKNELAKTVSVYEQRILRLEEENQVLRTRLDELMRKLDESNPYPIKEDQPLPIPRKLQDYKTEQETTIRPPVTKDVWLGNEKEEVVKVLDKKYNSLPDYCYFTDEDDLFYEYNLENCEKKRQKMEERIKKLHNKQDKHEESIDDIIKRMGSDLIYKSKDIKYDDYLAKTTEEILKSFEDEIQEIKSSRLTTTADIDDDNLNTKSTKDKENKQKAGDGSNLDKKRKPQQPVNQDKKKKSQQPYEGSGKEDKKKKPNNYEGSGKQDNKKSKDSKKRGKNQENNSDADKSKNQQKRPKLSKQKAVDDDDWIERRSTGREDARIKKENEENWYLKRKNDREIHRLTETIGN